MDTIHHGNPYGEAGGPAPGQAGPGGPLSPGPTPSPHSPSPMTPGPSMHSGGPGGSPGGGAGVHPAYQTRPGEAGGGHADCQCGSHHPSAAFAGHSPGHAQTGPYYGAPMHHPPLHQAHHYGYYPQGGAYQQYDVPGDPGYSLFGLNLSDGNFWKGALVGAAVTLLVTNETVQKTIMKGVASAYTAAEDAAGEIKEKFEDAQAAVRKPPE